MNERCKNTFEYPYEYGLVSAIILSYNSGDFLIEAIDSVIQQDYPMIELIITDDGSDDFCENTLREYIEKNKQNNILKYSIIHREQNIGTVKNINYALAISKGEYIKILGGDDTYPIPNIFSQQVKCIQDSNTIVAIGKLQQCNHKMEPIYDERVERSNSDLRKVLQMEYTAARRYIANRDIFPIANQAVCYHRKFFEKKGFCDEDFILIEDISLALKILSEAENASFMDVFTVNHRAKVGISTSRELFAPRRLLYYHDCITFALKEIDSHPEIYGFVYRKENLRVSTLIYKLAKAKKEEKGLLSLFFIGIQYLDTIIYYIVSNPKKFFRRIKERILG